jgi:hypothetical protein
MGDQLRPYAAQAVFFKKRRQLFAKLDQIAGRPFARLLCMVPVASFLAKVRLAGIPLNTFSLIGLATSSLHSSASDFISEARTRASRSVSEGSALPPIRLSMEASYFLTAVSTRLASRQVSTHPAALSCKPLRPVDAQTSSRGPTEPVPAPRAGRAGQPQSRMYFARVTVVTSRNAAIDAFKSPPS